MESNRKLAAEEEVKRAYAQMEATSARRERDVLAVSLYGSQNYGMDDMFSDFDMKATVLPSLMDVAQNKKLISTTHMGGNGLIDIKDIRLMSQNLKKQSINYVEILFTKFRVVNPLYRKELELLHSNREMMARYDQGRALSSFVGMAYNKARNIKKNNYESNRAALLKDLISILRLSEFQIRYINGEKYEDILVTENALFLLDLKKDKTLSIENIETLADNKLKKMKLLNETTKDKFTVDYKAEQLLDSVCEEILRKHFIK